MFVRKKEDFLFCFYLYKITIPFGWFLHVLLWAYDSTRRDSIFDFESSYISVVSLSNLIYVAVYCCKTIWVYSQADKAKGGKYFHRCCCCVFILEFLNLDKSTKIKDIYKYIYWNFVVAFLLKHKTPRLTFLNLFSNY